MFCHQGFWLIGWPHVFIVVMAIIGAVATAIWSYFALHADLRNRDGTTPTVREMWQHIFGLLAYFVLGFVVFGGGTLAALRIAHAL